MIKITKTNYNLNYLHAKCHVKGVAQTEFFLCIKHMIHLLSVSYLKNWTIKLQSAFLQNGKVMLKFRLLSIVFVHFFKMIYSQIYLPFSGKVVEEWWWGWKVSWKPIQSQHAHFLSSLTSSFFLLDQLGTSIPPNYKLPLLTNK